MLNLSSRVYCLYRVLHMPETVHIRAHRCTLAMSTTRLEMAQGETRANRVLCSS